MTFSKMKPQMDYSLYLVTDSTDAILGQRDLCEVVQQAIEGGKSHDHAQHHHHPFRH